MSGIFQLSTLGIGTILLSALTCVFLFESSRHHRKVKAYLLQNLPADEVAQREAARMAGLKSVAAVGVSLFDVLYNTARLDPFVLKGIDHLHHARQQFDNLGDLVNYMKAHIIDSEAGTKAWRQMIHKYKGYTGEEQALATLDHSGASVLVPDSGMNPGFDAIVNGHHINFAITDSPSYIQGKLDSDPSILVITNKEMAPAFGDNARVIIDPDLSSLAHALAYA